MVDPSNRSEPTSWPWPAPEEQRLAQQEAPTQWPPLASSGGVNTPSPHHLTPAPPKAPRRRGVPAGVVAVIAVLALMLGTLLGLVLAPTFGIETQASPEATSAPAPTMPSTLVTPPANGSASGTSQGDADISAIAAQALRALNEGKVKGKKVKARLVEG